MSVSKALRGQGVRTEEVEQGKDGSIRIGGSTITKANLKQVDVDVLRQKHGVEVDPKNVTVFEVDMDDPYIVELLQKGGSAGLTSSGREPKSQVRKFTVQTKGIQNRTVKKTAMKVESKKRASDIEQAKISFKDLFSCGPYLTKQDFGARLSFREAMTFRPGEQQLLARLKNMRGQGYFSVRSKCDAISQPLRKQLPKLPLYFQQLKEFVTQFQTSDQTPNELQVKTHSATRLDQTQIPRIAQTRDAEFPANQNSLGANVDKIVWLPALKQRRVSEKVPSKKLVQFMGPAGIKGPAIYGVLAVLRVLGAGFITFLLPAQNPRGEAFYIRLFLGGVWRYSTVDYLYPCSDYVPVCSVSTGQECWPALVEKAYVKAYGTYFQYLTRTPDIADVINELTGSPTFHIPVEELIKAKTLLKKGEPVIAVLRQDAVGLGLSLKYAYLVREFRGKLAEVAAPCGVIKQGTTTVPISGISHFITFKSYNKAYSYSFRIDQSSSSVKHYTKSANCYLTLHQQDRRLYPDGASVRYQSAKVTVESPSLVAVTTFQGRKRLTVQLPLGWSVVSWECNGGQNCTQLIQADIYGDQQFQGHEFITPQERKRCLQQWRSPPKPVKKK